MIYEQYSLHQLSSMQFICTVKFNYKPEMSNNYAKNKKIKIFFLNLNN